MHLALANAFDLGGVQGIDPAPALMLALLAHALGQPEVGCEDTLQLQFAADLSRDVAADPTEIGSGARRRREAPLNQLRELLLAHALAHQALFGAVFHPASAQLWSFKFTMELIPAQLCSPTQYRLEHRLA